MRGFVCSDFWKDKRVFLTGHTGFKGSWLAFWLHSMGAKVAGYALEPNTRPSIFDVLALSEMLAQSQIADIRDLSVLSSALKNFEPDVVVHMAAQPLVRYSYLNPIETYEINVMGTANLLDAMRGVSSIGATVIVTTDKCYENYGRQASFIETDPIGGYDPYSSSKGCAELVTSAFRRSFFNARDCKNAIATARAGNVIGGGDWSDDRLIPDAIRALVANEVLLIRNPGATRPWQHVLEPLSGYLQLAQALFEGGSTFASGWNFGPDEVDIRPVSDVISLFNEKWGEAIDWSQNRDPQPYEAQVLSLNCSKAKEQLKWHPHWSLGMAIEKIVQWHKAFLLNEDMRSITKQQINDYHVFKLLK